MGVVARIGLPGSGKSYLAVKEDIIPALLSGRRVVTNIPIDPFMLTIIYGIKNIGENLKILTDDELKGAFWYGDIRSKEFIELPPESSEEKDLAIEVAEALLNDDPSKNVKRQKYAYTKPTVYFPGDTKGAFTGALVVYDEMQRGFSAAKWSESEKDGSRARMRDWLSHHRHIGADLIWLSQSETLVDNAVRALSDMMVFTTKLQLPSWVPAWGGVRFRSRTYMMTDGKAILDETLLTEVFTADPRVYRCYKSFEVGGSGQHSRSGGMLGTSSVWRLWALGAIVIAIPIIYTLSPVDYIGRPKKRPAAAPTPQQKAALNAPSKTRKMDDKKEIEFDGFFDMGLDGTLLLCGGDVVGSCARCEPWNGGSDSLANVDSTRSGIWFRRVSVCGDRHSGAGGGAPGPAVPPVAGSGN